MAQCYALLPLGGVAIWVCRDFIRQGKRMPFGDQWRRLCESIGFETEIIYRAWRSSYPAQQQDLCGVVDLTKSHKGVFRCQNEAKGSPKVGWEEIIVCRK